MTRDTGQVRFPSVREAISAYLTAHRNGRPLVITEAVRQLRADVPRSVLTDRELSDEVARRAIREGFDVHFDRPR